MFYHLCIACSIISYDIYLCQGRDALRRTLWNTLIQLVSIGLPWCTIRYFNAITDVDEKLGGILYDMRKSFEFWGVIEACSLTDLGFHSSKFT